MIQLTCTNCGNHFELRTWDLAARTRAGSKNFYCNRECYLKHQPRWNKKRLRNQEMKRLRYSENGSKRFTLREIGEQFGVSAQRVHQILKH